MAPAVAEAERLRKRLAGIDADYDRGDIDAKRWKSAKQHVQAELAEIDKKLAARRGGAALVSSAECSSPGQGIPGRLLDGSAGGDRRICEKCLRVRPRNGGAYRQGNSSPRYRRCRVEAMTMDEMVVYCAGPKGSPHPRRVLRRYTRANDGTWGDRIPATQPIGMASWGSPRTSLRKRITATRSSCAARTAGTTRNAA